MKIVFINLPLELASPAWSTIVNRNKRILTVQKCIFPKIQTLVTLGSPALQREKKYKGLFQLAEIKFNIIKPNEFNIEIEVSLSKELLDLNFYFSFLRGSKSAKG